MVHKRIGRVIRRGARKVKQAAENIKADISESIRKGAGGQIVGGGLGGREPARPIKTVPKSSGFTPVRSVTPSRGLGGGGGGGGSSSPAPSPAPFSPQVQAVRQQVELAKDIRAEATRKGVSPEVIAARRRTVSAQQFRREAKVRGADISTPLRERAFQKELKESRVRTTGRARFERDEAGVSSVIIPTQVGEVSLTRPTPLKVQRPSSVVSLPESKTLKDVVERGKLESQRALSRLEKFTQQDIGNIQSEVRRIQSRDRDLSSTARIVGLTAGATIIGAGLGLGRRVKAVGRAIPKVIKSPIKTTTRLGRQIAISTPALIRKIPSAIKGQPTQLKRLGAFVRKQPAVSAGVVLGTGAVFSVSRFKLPKILSGKPKTPKITGIADVTVRGSKADVKIQAVARTGRRRVDILSRQQIKGVGKSVITGQGTSIAATKTPKGTEFAFSKFIGEGKQLGTAKKPERVFGFKREGRGFVAQEKLLSKKLGEGVTGKAFSFETLRILQRRGLRVGVPQLKQLRPKDIRIAQEGRRRFLRVDLQPSSTIGLIKRRDGRLSAFVGTSTRPITRIGRRGLITQRIPTRDLNIDFAIRTTFKSDDDVTRILLKKPIKRGKSSELSQLESTLSSTLEKGVSKSIAVQSAAIQQQAKIVLPRIKPPKRILPALLPAKQRTLTPGGRFEGLVTPKGRFDIDLTARRTGDLGVISTRLDIGTRTKGRGKLLTRQRQRPIKLEREVLKSAQPQRIRQRALLGQAQKSAQALRTRRRLITKTVLSRTPVVLPNIIVQRVGTPIKIPKIPQFKTRRRRKGQRLTTPTVGRSDIALSEGFTAKVLKLEPITIKKMDIEKLSDLPATALGIRRPIIIVNNNRRNR